MASWLLINDICRRRREAARVICPACNIGIRFELAGSSQAYHSPGVVGQQLGYDIAHGFCPECSHLIVLLRQGRYYEQNDYRGEPLLELVEVRSQEVLHPKGSLRALAEEIPAEYRKDFLEANAVLAVSSKASAALSRRLLQQALRAELGIKERSLEKELDRFLALPGIPSYLTGAVDAVRQVGNFAAHATKDGRTGEIVPVEPGEAEWLLDVLESLFDFVFVQPQRLAKRREALNAKLEAVGKPALKAGPSNDTGPEED